MHSCVANGHYRHAPHEQSQAAALDTQQQPQKQASSHAGPSAQKATWRIDSAYTALKWPTASGNGAECMYMLCVGSAKAAVAPDSMLDAEKMTRWASEKQHCDEQ